MKNNTLKSMLTSIDVIITRREESKMHDRARYSLAHIGLKYQLSSVLFLVCLLRFRK